MDIGLVDVDSHKFPNLALMKISAWHKKQGDHVEWAIPLLHYDKVYVAKVFGDEYSKYEDISYQADEIVFGGTGFAIKIENGKEVFHKELDKDLPYEIEHIYPDYDLYPELTKETAYGFLTRGCCNNCNFCIVSKKEGLCVHKVADLSEFWSGQKKIMLLDANILACREHKALLQQLIDSNAKVDFVQGLDARFVTKDNAQLLKQINRGYVHFAFDYMKNEKMIVRGMKTYADIVGLPKDPMCRICYMLTNYDTTHEEDMYRINKIRECGFTPYVMIYRKQTAPKITKYLQRWCNNRFVYKSCDFKDYAPKSDGKTIQEMFYNKEQ